MLSDFCCDPYYIEYPFRYKHLFEDGDSTLTTELMDSTQNSKDSKRPKQKSKSFVFWKKTPSKTPGSIKQVRGAQYPPITNKNNPYKVSSDKKRHSASITLKVSSMSDSHLNYKQTNNPPLHPQNNGNSEKQINAKQIDMNDLIESVKEERAKQIKEENELNEKQVFQSIDPSQILEWDEIKNENERMFRKNRNRINLLTKMLSDPVLDSTSLRRACWRGIPNVMRPNIWKLLLGYIPKNTSRRITTLNKKRDEYYDLMERYYNQTLKEHRSDQENRIVHQIGLDVPRTSPELKLFQIKCIENLLSRALYIWSLRHTATGYVQGINDLITPFVYIFLDQYLQQKYNGISLENREISRKIISENKIDKKDLLEIEADSYWCLDYLIEGLQLNYTDNQPGIYNMVSQLEEVVKRVNNKLYTHFNEQKIEIFQFSFRWMNCLLMRELSLSNIIRLWDTYLCEGVALSAGFSEFHVFVCAALLLSFADSLMKKDFAEIMLFLQDLPSVTAKWGERQIETILSEAFVYQQLFGKNKKPLF